MITIRRSEERGYADHGWLKSFHTFSFADYYDTSHMGFGNLRVINEDRIAAGRGFGTHFHRDMEIVSYVLEGELAHADSMGNGHPGGASTGVIRPGDVQRMSAGTGVRHSEYNHSKDGVTHFLQIGILPDNPGSEPSYEQKHFDVASKRGQLRLVASADGREGSVRLGADAAIFAGMFDGPETASLDLDRRRMTYIQVLRGEVSVNGTRLSAGDGAALSDEDRLTITEGREAEVLVFDLKAPV